MTSRAIRRREASAEWMPNSANVPKERRLWQALYAAVGSYDIALKVCDAIILWPVCRPPEHYLRRWAVEIQMNEATPDPALEKLMLGSFDRYKTNRHWQFIEGQIEAANVIAEEIKTTGKAKQPIAISYLGANANYGMDKGSHAPQQSKQQQFINHGRVSIITGRGAPPITTTDTKKAKRLMAPKKAVDAEFRVVE